MKSIGIVARWKSNSTFNQEILSKWSTTVRANYHNAANQMYNAWFAFDAVYTYALALDRVSILIIIIDYYSSF